MEEIMVEVKNLSKSFRIKQTQSDSLKQYVTDLFKGKNRGEKFTALNHIFFTLKKGEALGIIGENGAGKSTLLKVLSGISQPDTGEINFYGKVVSILEIGAGFHPDLTGSENIYLTGALYGFTRKEIAQRYEQIVDFSDIRSFIHEPVKNYSSGMYLRLAFSIITCIDADIYLIDEVINVGDANFQSKCKSRMEELIAVGKTMVIASHNLNEIVALCNRIILMEHGEIIQEGGNEVIQKYMTKALPQFFSFTEGTSYHITDVKAVPNSTCGLSLEECTVQSEKFYPTGISNGHPLTISFRFRVKERVRYLLGLKVYDSTSVLLFVSYSLQHIHEMREPGSYKIHFHIPADIFNDRMYYADLAIINYDTQTLCGAVDKCVSFNMTSGDEVAEIDIKNYLRGIIKPKVNTQIEKL